jgi:hypothetical protein
MSCTRAIGGDADESWRSNFCEERYLALVKRLSFMTIAFQGQIVSGWFVSGWFE